MNHNIIFLIFIALGGVSCGDEIRSGMTCKNSLGQLVGNGEHFTPLGGDPCTQCTCVDGKRDRCRSLLCSPIKKCEHQKPSPDKCCEFVCIELPGNGKNGTIIINKGGGNNRTITINKGGGQINATNLGLRLVASTVTSFLILALLLFMIHRLRQRRLLLMIRRLNNERMHNGTNSSQRYSIDGDIGVGYFVGRDQVDFYGYGDPPPPYTLWKPPDVYIPPGEPPPPYEASLATSIPSYNSLPQNQLVNDCALHVELPRYSQAHENVQNQERNTSSANETDTISADAQYDDHHGLNSPQVSSNRAPKDVSSARNRVSVNLMNSQSWANCPSDSSSSSPSPTCDRTISPTSSEGSSILDFAMPANCRGGACSVPKRTNTLPKYFHHPYWANQASRASRSLDKKFQNFRRFSLMQLKQKSKCEVPVQAEAGCANVMTESQCSTVSNPETSTSSCSSTQNERSVRPRSLILPEFNYSAESVEPPSAACATSRQKPQSRECFSCSRSGSICSETGERKCSRPLRNAQLYSSSVSESMSVKSKTSNKSNVKCSDVSSASLQCKRTNPSIEQSSEPLVNEGSDKNKPKSVWVPISQPTDENSSVDQPNLNVLSWKHFRESKM